MYTISDLELKKIQDKNFELLCFFKDFCEKHKLKFFLSGGSCLGAVRHKGFIPWDDDVDLLMPRKDYEKLETLWNMYVDTKKYSICRPNDTLANGNKYITIHDNNSTFIQKGRESFDANHGVALEVLPLDGYPKKNTERYLQIFWAIIFSLYANQTVPLRAKGVSKLICKFLLHLVSSRKKQYQIFHYAEKQMSKYDINDCDFWAVLCTFKNIKHKYSKRMFTETAWLNFNGVEMPCPSDYDSYLKMLYGDYMKLPPENEQLHKHECVFLDLDTPYYVYKGEYYGKRK